MNSKGSTFFKRDYCAVIRTLGTAGEKYQTLLDSLAVQTLTPKKILVYIPHGYAVPKETISIEQLVRCEKGMVAQRSLPFDEVDTEFILFCDDDLYLPPDYVEKLFIGLEENDGDCVAAEVFYHYKDSLWKRVLFYFSNSFSPRGDDSYAYKIKRDGGTSYNVAPSTSVLPTQTAAFASFLCKKDVYKAIHFDDERWLDSFSFSAEDDTLFFYKLFLYGYKVFVHFVTGIKHLDGKSGNRIGIEDRMLFKKKLLFIFWYRTIYNIKTKNRREKLLCCLAFIWRNLLGIVALIGDVIRCKQPVYLLDYFRGLYVGYRYVHSDEYKAIPLYDEYLI